MKEILTYVMLDGTGKDKDIVNRSIDLEKMVSKARSVASDTTFQTFYEEPEDDIIVTVKAMGKEKKVEAEIILRDAYYQKHIGKYMDSERVLLEYMMSLEKNLDEVCWRTQAGHHCGGGCHG